LTLTKRDVIGIEIYDKSLDTFRIFEYRGQTFISEYKGRRKEILAREDWSDIELTKDAKRDMLIGYCF
jgi:hypothetical protein